MAQQAVEPGRITYAKDASPGAATRIIAIPGKDAVMVLYGDAAWLWQPSQLTVLRRAADPDSFETVTTDHLHTEKLVQVTKAKDTTLATLHDVMSHEDIGKISADETLLMLADAHAGNLIVTRQGAEWDSVRNAPGDARLLLRKGRNGQPFVSLTLPMDGAKNSTVSTALSPDGKTLGVTANGRGWLIDLATGRERPLALAMAATTKATTRIENMAFTPNGKRIIAGVDGEGFIVLDAVTQKQVADVKTPKMARKMKMVARAGGRVVEVQGRRERAVIDVATGKHVLAQRISSGHAFQLDWAGRDLVVRASRPRLAKKTTYGVYRHVNGDFKQLYRIEREKLTLAGVAASPNGACLYIGSASATAIHDLATDKPILTVTGLKAPFEVALFTSNGQRVFGVDAEGRTATVDTPQVCHGQASR